MTKKVLNVSEVGEGGWGLSLQSRTGNTLEMTITVLFVGPKKHVFFWGQKQTRPKTPRNGICVAGPKQVDFETFIGKGREHTLPSQLCVFLSKI